jgi:hypothetical protein
VPFLVVLLGQTHSSDRTAGIVFLVALLSVTAVWWAVMRRRQQWWWGFERRPGDNTNERWLRSNEARADKPMPERRIVVQRQRRRW